jgi:Trk K+ transport system NAD-binding subunit
MKSNNSTWIIIRRMRIPFLVIIVTFAVSILGLTIIPGVDDQGNPYRMNFLDAIYFVSYMASTIGFGEAPYTFTYPQRLWVLVCIYFTVIGWFYGIGTIVALIQDKKLAVELATNRFRKKIKSLNEPFIIILGYNNITKNIIDKLTEESIRVVVVDKNEEKIGTLELENFIPEVPGLAADVTNPDTLKLAGIHKKNCQAVVSLFDDDVKNTKIALMCRLLNKHINLVIKSTTESQTEHLKNLGIHYIEDPFKFIANRFYLALTSPDLWLLEMWIFGHILKLREREKIPRGLYILCGYGRMGHAIGGALERAGIPYNYIDLKSANYKRKKQSAIFGDAEDYRMLLDAGIKEAEGIIAATKDDLINLTILSTAKKLNEKIYTIARENSIDDLSIFKTARVNRIYILEKILSEFAYTYIARPLAYRFVRILHTKEESWGRKLVERMHDELGDNPLHFEVTIDERGAYALFHELEAGKRVTLSTLKRSRADCTQKLQLIFLLAIRGDETILLPDEEMEVERGMRLLITATDDAKRDFEYVVNNYYELYYVMTGKEKSYGIWEWLQNRKERES